MAAVCDKLQTDVAPTSTDAGSARQPIVVIDGVELTEQEVDDMHHRRISEDGLHSLMKGARLRMEQHRAIAGDPEGSDAGVAAPPGPAPTGAECDVVYVPLCKRHSFEEIELYRQPKGHIPGSTPMVAVDGCELTEEEEANIRLRRVSDDGGASILRNAKHRMAEKDALMNQFALDHDPGYDTVYAPAPARAPDHIYVAPGDVVNDDVAYAEPLRRRSCSEVIISLEPHSPFKLQPDFGGTRLDGDGNGSMMMSTRPFQT